LNLEYIASVVRNENGLLFPDSCVGTDSHTVMINSIGVVGWCVGGIDALAVMLGECIGHVIPQCVGIRLHGKLRPGVLATDFAF